LIVGNRPPSGLQIQTALVINEIMSAADPHPAEPVALLRSLDPERIQARLDDLDRETRALRVLLRSARARQRRNDTAPQAGEAPYAQ
jgi:hypothetical protein